MFGFKEKFAKQNLGFNEGAASGFSEATDEAT